MSEIVDFLRKDSRDILRTAIKVGSIEVKPLTVAQVIDINPFLAAIAMEDLDEFQDDIKAAQKDCELDGTVKEVYASKMIKFVGKYGKILAKVLEICIGRDVSSEITPEEMVYIFSAILYRTDATNFLKSISYAKMLSPISRVGLIAAQSSITPN